MPRSPPEMMAVLCLSDKSACTLVLAGASVLYSWKSPSFMALSSGDCFSDAASGGRATTLRTIMTVMKMMTVLECHKPAGYIFLPLAQEQSFWLIKYLHCQLLSCSIWIKNWYMMPSLWQRATGGQCNLCHGSLGYSERWRFSTLDFRTSLYWVGCGCKIALCFALTKGHQHVSHHVYIYGQR